MTNLDTVNEIYAAFGRGDIATLLSKLSDDVRWEDWADNTAQKVGVPWMEARKGRQGAAEFFKLVAQFEIKEFKVLSVMAGGNQVAAEFVIEARVPGTGKTYRDEEMHLWTFDEAGRVVRLRHYTDTAKHIATAGVRVRV
jgi:uncharacterized protein